MVVLVVCLCEECAVEVEEGESGREEGCELVIGVVVVHIHTYNILNTCT